MSLASLETRELSMGQAIFVALKRGEILTSCQDYGFWGGFVMAQMYLPVKPPAVWQQITDYPRWVNYFPNVTRSEVIAEISHSEKHLYQQGGKAFGFLAVNVDIYLTVIEKAPQRVAFQLRSDKDSCFSKFEASLQLQDYDLGTLLTYLVQAMPKVPVPTFLIQETIRRDLPDNLAQMRQVLVNSPR